MVEGNEVQDGRLRILTDHCVGNGYPPGDFAASAVVQRHMRWRSQMQPRQGAAPAKSTANTTRGTGSVPQQSPRPQRRPRCTPFKQRVHHGATAAARSAAASPPRPPSLIRGPQKILLLGVHLYRTPFCLFFYLHALARSGSLIALHIRSSLSLCFRSGTDRGPNTAQLSLSFVHQQPSTQPTLYHVLPRYNQHAHARARAHVCEMGSNGRRVPCRAPRE